jgi:hypothetical protein
MGHVTIAGKELEQVKSLALEVKNGIRVLAKS